LLTVPHARRGRPATCYDAAPSGAHARSIREHARIFTATDGSDMADEAAFAVENFPLTNRLHPCPWLIVTVRVHH
jgi:hypothetical protein